MGWREKSCTASICSRSRAEGPPPPPQAEMKANISTLEKLQRARMPLPTTRTLTPPYEAFGCFATLCACITPQRCLIKLTCSNTSRFQKLRLNFFCKSMQALPMSARPWAHFLKKDHRGGKTNNTHQGRVMPRSRAEPNRRKEDFQSSSQETARSSVIWYGHTPPTSLFTE